MARLYFDASYLVRLYLEDAHTEQIRDLANHNDIVASLHGRTELIAAFHRAFREDRFSQKAFRALLDQFSRDEEENRIVEWIWVEADFFRRAQRVYRDAAKNIFLRAADAMHLACAAESGFWEVYSNDRHFLAAAPPFGLKGRNIIAPLS